MIPVLQFYNLHLHFKVIANSEITFDIYCFNGGFSLFSDEFQRKGFFQKISPNKFRKIIQIIQQINVCCILEKHSKKLNFILSLKK